MASPIAVNVGTQPSQLWSGRATTVNTLLLMNTDQQNTVYVGTSLTSLVVPIQPNGSLSVDPTENWYVVGTVAGSAPLVVVPNGQSNFLGLSQGYGDIAIPQFQSPNYNAATGVGWALFKNGTASFNEITLVIQANGVALLIYFPTPGLGNLIGSWAAAGFTDQYGNVVPAGLNASGGALSSILLSQPSVVGGTILNALLNASTITASNITGGTSYEQTITFDSGGGMLFGYTTTVTNVSQTTPGDYQITLPAGVTTINNAYCWGAGAGGDGGQTTQGGNGGGAGEFAGESIYTPSGSTFSYTVGSGGNSSTTGAGHGGDGGDSFIDNGGVFANGGNGDGTPGTGSTNSIHHNGGSGGNSSGNSGAASGGNSGNPTAAGNSGISSTGSSGAASPAAQTNSGTGGAGGSNGANGSNAGTPGAGGGGAGEGSGTPGTLTKTYEALYTASYYGPDATNGNPNGLRSTSTFWQGGETASGGSANGNQRCVFVFDTAQMASDFAGYTMTQCTLKLVNEHTWYDGGSMDVEFDEGAILYPTSGAPSTWKGSQNKLATGTISEGTTHSYGLGAGPAGDLVAQRTNFLGLGAFVAADEPYNVNWYGYFAGGHSTNLEVTLEGTETVSGSTTSGTGGNGKVSFSYASTQAMVFALAPQSGTDSNSNAFAAGYTGPVSVFDPNASPNAVEAWHSLTLTNGWAKQGFARYKLVGYNLMLVEFQINDSSATSGSFFNMPTNYTASTGQFFSLAVFNNTAGAPLQNVAIAQVGTGAGAAVSILDWAKQSKQYVGNFFISLD